MKKIKNIFSPNPSPAPPPVAVVPRPSKKPPLPENAPRLLFIGAGSRGSHLAEMVCNSSDGMVAAVADPDPYKRRSIGRRYIWGQREPQEGEEFDGWKEFLEWELTRRKGQNDKEAKATSDDGAEDAGDKRSRNSTVIDAIVICTADHTHREIVVALAPLGIHMMCEKPLATDWKDCLEISRSLGCDLRPGKDATPSSLFAIGHMLRYAHKNRALRLALCEEKRIGDIVSVEHTENVGWWHFAHSYVRGNWRKESTSGPTLLTKSCHDIDFLMWLLCSGDRKGPPHLPSSVTSFGSVTHFRQSRKPAAAGAATNCTSCPAEENCIFSAKKIYYEKGLVMGLGGWPVDVVVPDIEDLLDEGGIKGAQEGINKKLAEDYTADTPEATVESKQWYGRCVFEADNDVCDDQTVHISWDDDPESSGQLAKTATFHMTAFSDGVCTKRTKIYGTMGEIELDDRISGVIVRDFKQGTTENVINSLRAGSQGTGSTQLMKHFVYAVDAVKNKRMTVEEAQDTFIGCTAEDILRSHAMVFAAEEARKSKRTVNWDEWWEKNTELGGGSMQ